MTATLTELAVAASLIRQARDRVRDAAALLPYDVGGLCLAEAARLASLAREVDALVDRRDRGGPGVRD